MTTSSTLGLSSTFGESSPGESSTFGELSPGESSWAVFASGVSSSGIFAVGRFSVGVFSWAGDVSLLSYYSDFKSTTF